jgi:hypothetical protein
MRMMLIAQLFIMLIAEHTFFGFVALQKLFDTSRVPESIYLLFERGVFLVSFFSLPVHE